VPAHIVDLDHAPELVRPVLGLFQEAGPGRRHAVCGMPVRMGQKPTAEDLANSLGTIALVDGKRLLGALTICAYSEDQATLWGPVVAAGGGLMSLGRTLVKEARTAMRDAGFTSLRALADSRNRDLRTFLLGQGLTLWKESHCYERLLHRVPAAPEGVRLATKRDHAAAAAILGGAFPDSGHCLPSLADREREGYRHYVVLSENLIVGVAAVQQDQRRSWIKLISVRGDLRGRGMAKRLLTGILAAESALGQREIGLEVLADNAAAIAAFESTNFRRAWTFGIFTGPV